MKDKRLAVTVGGLAIAGAYMVARLSPHFSWPEMTTTGTGLGNKPNLIEQVRLAMLARFVLEPLRARFGPVRVTSAFRSKAVNDAVGGVSNSDHRKGTAADVYSNASHEEMAAWLYSSGLPLGQVIVERHTGHLHVSMGFGKPAQFLQTADGRVYQPWKPS